MGAGLMAQAQIKEEYIAQAQTTPSSTERNDISKSVSLFPNPAIEYINVKIEQLPAEDLKVGLHNIIGNEIPAEVEITDKHELRIRVKDLAAGYYLLTLKSEAAHFRGTYKFVKR